jgi:hypothetical protein
VQVTEPIVVYCDDASDELLAQASLLSTQGIPGALIERLPSYANAPTALRAMLRWERLDWVVTRGGRILCAVEFSRHGYTGDNGFQRFARLLRAAELGVPSIYFTPFSRTRLNELDLGTANARNVAPELFLTLDRLSGRHGVPCLAVAWPTSADGTPFPLNLAEAHHALAIVRDLVRFFAEHGNPGPNASLASDFPEVITGMRTHAARAFRGTETRGTVALPVDLLARDWIDTFLPATYFAYGKADKALASLALRALPTRALTRGVDLFWDRAGRARVLYLGYQWRPDPASGLIALTEAQRAPEERLVVVWPRAYLDNGQGRGLVMDALRRFKRVGDGALRDELNRLGVSDKSIAEFRSRVSVNDNQFGLFRPESKPGRILQDLRALVIFGDGAVLYE